MADEPRRSGRATKGQNHKNSEEPEAVANAPPPPPAAAPTSKGKKGKGKRSKKAAQEEEEEEEPEAIIRCICGYVKEDPDDTRAMICCDKCSAWQHNVCMGLPEDEDDLPDQYYCEQCRPQDHQQTVLALKRGEKIWDIRQAEREREKEEEKQRKKGKKGRKSKGGRASEATELEVQSSSQQAELASSQSLAADEFYGKEKTETGQKRKASEIEAVDEEYAEANPTNKTRRVSTKESKAPPRRQSSTVVQGKSNTKHVELQTELVQRIEDLHNKVRQRAAGAFVKLFEQMGQQASEERKFKLPKGQSLSSYSLALGLEIEYCLYLDLWGHGSEPNPPYSEKMRAILHNIKGNPDLRDRVLNRSLTPQALTQMGSDEMASRELQAEKAQIIKETEKQHILQPDVGPKFRKTHKGDELIEDSSHHFVNTESAPQLSTRIHEKGSKEESPDRMGSHSPTAFQPPSFRPGTTPLSVDTQVRRRSTIDRKSSSGFDMNNVWSSVDSPSASRPIPTPNTPGLRGPGAQADAEIDKLLGDDDEKPYSPVEYVMDPGTIWRGNVVMPTVSEFRVSAKYAAGANLEASYPWPDLIGKTLWIEGRIQGKVASEYVCNLRWSKTTDVSIISVTPNDTPQDQANFTKLFDYFTTRQRWGVGKSPLEHTKDVYVIPLESGNAPKPEFLNLLEDSVVGDDRPERMLLVVYIIRFATSQSDTLGTPATPAQQIAYSPAGAGQRGTNGTSDHTVPDTITSTGAKPSSNGNITFAPAETTKEGPAKVGREAADFILGPDLVHAATVNQLLAEAPNCGEEQWSHVRQCYLEDPRTKDDWKLLVDALVARAEKNEAEEASKKALATKV